MPFFDLQTYPLRESYYTEAVTRGFGEPPDAFRAVTVIPGASWRTAVLGLTLNRYRQDVPRAMRSLVVPATEQARSLVDSIRDPYRQTPPRLSPVLTLLERLPETLFIRLLELLNYPKIAWKASLSMWEVLESRLRYLSETTRDAGRRFLGTPQLMRDRLRAGGLLASDRETLNVLALGALGEYHPRLGWLQDILTLIDWITEQFRYTKPSVKTRLEQPTPVDLMTLTYQTRFHLFGLELETWMGNNLVARSTMEVQSQPSFHFYPYQVPVSISPSMVLQKHTARWSLEHRRRQALYRLGNRILSLVMKYLVLGPVGLIVCTLHLIAEQILDVVPHGHNLTWSNALPT